MLHLSRNATIGLLAGGLALGSAAGGGVYANNEYITGPKHDTRFEATGYPLSMDYTGDMTFKDYVVDVGAGAEGMRFSMWKANEGLEPQAFRMFLTNQDTFTRAVIYNREQRDGAREALQVCDFSGYGRVGYVDGLHYFLVEDVMSGLMRGEYAQQTRFNLESVKCDVIPVSLDDRIWDLPAWDGENPVISVDADGYGSFRVVAGAG